LIFIHYYFDKFLFFFYFFFNYFKINIINLQFIYQKPNFLIKVIIFIIKADLIPLNNFIIFLIVITFVFLFLILMFKFNYYMFSSLRIFFELIFNFL